MRIVAAVLPASVIATILVALAAYHQYGVTPFAIPISSLTGSGPGGWGYNGILAALVVVVAIGAWLAGRRQQWHVVGILLICIVLLVILKLNPEGSPSHEPAALCVDWGYLHDVATEQSGHAGDRGVIVPSKPGNAGGGKDARKVTEDARTLRKPRLAEPMRPKPDERATEPHIPRRRSARL